MSLDGILRIRIYYTATRKLLYPPAYRCMKHCRYKMRYIIFRLSKAQTFFSNAFYLFNVTGDPWNTEGLSQVKTKLVGENLLCGKEKSSQSTPLIRLV